MWYDPVTAIGNLVGLVAPERSPVPLTDRIPL
jgi:hypothetical protein